MQPGMGLMRGAFHALHFELIKVLALLQTVTQNSNVDIHCIQWMTYVRSPSSNVGPQSVCSGTPKHVS